MLQPGVQEEVKNLHATMEKHLSRQELLMEAPERLVASVVRWMRDVVTILNHCCREIDIGCLEMSGLILVRFPSKSPICLFENTYFDLAALPLTYETSITITVHYIKNHLTLHYLICSNRIFRYTLIFYIVSYRIIHSYTLST